MASDLLENEPFQHQAQVECRHCSQMLPLRISEKDEPATVWLCATCSVPFVARCLQESLPDGATTVVLDDRYFDTNGLAPVSAELRRQVCELASRKPTARAKERRRSTRIPHSLVVPAVTMDVDFNPVGIPFQAMVANISKEGIGLVSNVPIHADFLALDFAPNQPDPLQVIVQLVRQRDLKWPYREYGGVFYVRLGKAAEQGVAGIQQGIRPESS